MEIWKDFHRNKCLGELLLPTGIFPSIYKRIDVANPRNISLNIQGIAVPNRNISLSIQEN